MVRMIAACLVAALALSAPLAVASPQVSRATIARQGGALITGAWRITGQYDQAGNGDVGFEAMFASDGTFVDRDGFAGRWIVSGDSFSMHYPDESQLGYVGRINGELVTGRFEGLDSSGTFEMRRAR